jgi:hypothetical protein
MEIREGHNCVTIEAVDRVPADLPSAGDVEICVDVASEQFSGHGFAWVAGPAFASRRYGYHGDRTPMGR